MHIWVCVLIGCPSLTSNFGRYGSMAIGFVSRPWYPFWWFEGAEKTEHHKDYWAILPPRMSDLPNFSIHPLHGGLIYTPRLPETCCARGQVSLVQIPGQHLGMVKCASLEAPFKDRTSTSNGSLWDGFCATIPFDKVTKKTANMSMK